MKFVYTLVSLSAIALLHVLALVGGVYAAQAASGFVWIDNLLHFLVGVTLGSFWLWIAGRNENQSQTFVLISTVFFVVVMALAWELFEFAFSGLFAQQARVLKLFSPTLIEAGTDVISNAAGALVLVTWKYFSRGRGKPDNNQE